MASRGDGVNVIIPNSFKAKLLTFDVNTRQAVLEFVAHVETHGLRNLKGRNKSSAPINPRTKRQRATFAYAQKHCLWHYHIGIPEYIGDEGDQTSEYVLHYQRLNDGIVLLGVDSHPPFVLPSVE